MGKFDLCNGGQLSHQRGYLGQVPKDIIVGEVICAISGAAVPFIIREHVKGYTLIGQCYLHAFMKAEAQNEPNVVGKDIVLTRKCIRLKIIPLPNIIFLVSFLF